jgi:hypothetical protein
MKYFEYSVVYIVWNIGDIFQHHVKSCILDVFTKFWKVTSSSFMFVHSHGTTWFHQIAIHEIW